MSSQDIYTRYRALFTFKVLTSKFNTKSIELLDIRLPPSLLKSPFEEESPPGSVEYHKERKCLHVKCAHNTFVEVFQLRIVGKKVMNAIDFNNGFLKKLPKTKREFYCNKTDIYC